MESVVPSLLHQAFGAWRRSSTKATNVPTSPPWSGIWVLPRLFQRTTSRNEWSKGRSSQQSAKAKKKKTRTSAATLLSPSGAEDESEVHGNKTEEQLRKEAVSPQHLFTHRPKNPYCETCKVAKMLKPYATRKGSMSCDFHKTWRWSSSSNPGKFENRIVEECQVLVALLLHRFSTWKLLAMKTWRSKICSQQSQVHSVGLPQYHAEVVIWVLEKALYEQGCSLIPIYSDWPVPWLDSWLDLFQSI